MPRHTQTCRTLFSSIIFTIYTRHAFTPGQFHELRHSLTAYQNSAYRNLDAEWGVVSS